MCGTKRGQVNVRIEIQEVLLRDTSVVMVEERDPET